MVSKETAPFDNPWLSAIDSTEKKLTRSLFSQRHFASERPGSLWFAHHPQALAAGKPSRYVNHCYAVAGERKRAEPAPPPVEAYQELELLPTLARISQRLQARTRQTAQPSAQDESVEVALRVVRKQRAARLK
ncbi:hypothetical protein BBB56_09415 [Candidatus Pantoea deserta]|uniref:Uncharacterized protein n=1 Tax=Candidatus Pantoea deserta TaxID=1869313 RepID=A0A3N4NZN0_9GAMM|nr:hypothetical protein [Pantoea deserta]RPE01495.1 hypothetical protein BBB56_09415 [Pantoea deserta]